MLQSTPDFVIEGRVGICRRAAMAETDKAAVAEILKPIMGLWVSRSERKAVRESGKLRFWKDGMLKQLRQVAYGKGTPDTLRKLRVALGESEEEVTTIIVVLKKVRNKLGSGRVARAIDEVLNDEDFGKGNIREEIRALLTGGSDTAERQQAAANICLHIEGLNASLDRLYRLVYE